MDLDEDRFSDQSGHRQTLMGKILNHYYQPNLLFYADEVGAASLWLACSLIDRSYQQIEIYFVCTISYTAGDAVDLNK